MKLKLNLQSNSTKGPINVKKKKKKSISLKYNILKQII